MAEFKHYVGIALVILSACLGLGTCEYLTAQAIKVRAEAQAALTTPKPEPDR